MPAGRPRTEIDQEQFEKLCGLQCSLNEIAGWFRCSDDTIENWCKREYKMNFSDVYKKYATSGKISLRRYQFELAQKHPAMAIWLGKQYLGQKDAPESEDPEALKRAKEILGGIESAIN